MKKEKLSKIGLEETEGKPIKPEKYDCEISYESDDAVMRWNYCQKIAKSLYRSDRTTGELREQLDIMEQAETIKEDE